MLACKRQRVEERIHQIGLAAADAAPHVQTIDRGPRLTAEPAARRRGDQLVIHALQSVDGACLRGIATEAADRKGDESGKRVAVSVGVVGVRTLKKKTNIE